MGTGSKWLTGCSIGCATVLLITVIGVFSVMKVVKNTFGDLEAVADLQEELADRYGTVEDFEPPVDGVIAAGRMEAFLAIQEMIYPVAFPLGDAADEIRSFEEDGVNGVGEAIAAFRTVRRIAGDVGAYLALRNEALLEHEMGMGEYTYIYTLSYHSWLGHDLLDIPGENDDGGKTTYERLHDNLVGMLQSQKDRLEMQVTADDPLLKALKTEILEMRIDEDRVMWQDGLPDDVAAALAPYRDRLEQWHCPISFLLGVGAENDHGGFDFQFN